MKLRIITIFSILFSCLASGVLKANACDATVTIELGREFEAPKLEGCLISRIVIKELFVFEEDWPSPSTLAALSQLAGKVVKTPKIKVEVFSRNANVMSPLEALKVKQAELYFDHKGHKELQSRSKINFNMFYVMPLVVGVPLACVAMKKPSLGRLYYATVFALTSFVYGILKASNYFLIQNPSAFRTLAADIAERATCVVPALSSLVFTKIHSNIKQWYAASFLGCIVKPMILKSPLPEGRIVCVRSDKEISWQDWQADTYDKNVFMTSDISDHCKSAFGVN